MAEEGVEACSGEGGTVGVGKGSGVTVGKHALSNTAHALNRASHPIRLAARIWELRADGMAIKTTMVTRNGKCIAEYSHEG